MTYDIQPAHNAAMREVINGLFEREIITIDDLGGDVWRLTLSADHNFKITPNFSDPILIFDNTFFCYFQLVNVPAPDQIDINGSSIFPPASAESWIEIITTWSNTTRTWSGGSGTLSVNLFSVHDQEVFTNEYESDSFGSSFNRSNFPLAILLSGGQFSNDETRFSNGLIEFDGFIYRFDLVAALRSHPDSNGDYQNSTSKRETDYFVADRMLFIMQNLTIDAWTRGSWLNVSNFSNTKNVSVESIIFKIAKNKTVRCLK